MPGPGKMAVIDRNWNPGDVVRLSLPMELTARRWHENSVGLHMGPLAFGLRIEESWEPQPEYIEVRAKSPWNFALREESLQSLSDHYRIVRRPGNLAENPWTHSNAPFEIQTEGVRLSHWGAYNDDAGPIPWSPQKRPDGAETEPITLLPYGCTTLRISAFPTVSE